MSKFFIAKRQAKDEKKGAYYVLGCDLGFTEILLNFDTPSIYAVSGLTAEQFAQLKVDAKVFLNEK